MMIRKIILSLVPGMIIFSFFETGLRLSPLDNRFSPTYRKGTLLDHVAFWKPEPAEVNPFGTYHDYTKEFRGMHYEKEKPDNLIRIVCLGGSSTAGWPLTTVSKIYPAVLEKLLNGHFKSKKFQVINAGVGGYTSFQDLMYLKHALLQYSPDIVTLCAGINDNSRTTEISTHLSDREYWEYMKARQEKPLKTVQVILNKLRDLLVNLRVYNALDYVQFKIRTAPKKRVPPEDFKENIDQIIKLSKLHNFKTLLITEAHRNADSIPEYMDILKNSSAGNNGASFVDTRPLLEDDGYFVDDMHPTYEGHEIIANAVFNALLEIEQHDGL